MARYHNEFRFMGDPKPVMQQIHNYLMSEKYEYLDFKGELVYKKGMGVATGPSFVKIMAGNELIVVEAWIKFAALPGVYAGETGIDGVLGAIPKSFLKTRVQYVESIITQAGGINLGTAIDMQPMQTYVPQQPYDLQQPPEQPVYNPQPVQQPVQQPTEQQPVQSAAPAFCIQCGNKLPPNAKFCNRCGAKVQ